MEPAQASEGSPSGVDSGKFLLPPGRSAGVELSKEIETVGRSAIIDGLLEAVHGLMAVLNENRQLLALNDGMLHALGVKSLEKVLGLRLGEAVHCIHADQAPGGCGTTDFARLAEPPSPRSSPSPKIAPRSGSAQSKSPETTHITTCFSAYAPRRS